MRSLLILEYAGLCLLSVVLFSGLEYSWWLYAALFFTPDIGMLGYLINPRVGAVTYNFFHHQGVAAVAYVLGVTLALPLLMLVGVVLLGHLNFDRLFGYGLKYPDSFRRTHLGKL